MSIYLQVVLIQIIWIEREHRNKWHICLSQTFAIKRHGQNNYPFSEILKAKTENKALLLTVTSG